jgi:hypothetical protein
VLLWCFTCSLLLLDMLLTILLLLLLLPLGAFARAAGPTQL